MQEKIVETKTCKHCNSSFEITDKDLEFYDKVSPIFGGKKYNIPAPTLCPDCRQQRRLSFRNERKLYKRKCDLTGKEIISIYSPDKPYKVYDQKEWWSDKWNSMDYCPAGGIDFSRGFFEQFNELLLLVPLQGLLNSNTENSEYNNYIFGAKNCYMSSVVYYDSENIFFSSWVYSSKNIIDCFFSDNSENCYNSIDINKCYGCFHSRNLFSSKNCFYCRNLDNCEYCIGCNNLKNKKYYIFNNPASKEEYEDMVKIIHKKEIQDKCIIEMTKGIYRYSNNYRCENCTGEYLRDSKNLSNCYDMGLGEDSKYISSEESKYCYDGRGGNNEKCYEFNNIGWSYNLMFSDNVIESYNILYSFGIFQSNNCFGCIGLRNKSYCILNKQYTKEEYEELVPKIIEHMKKTGEWGEFFPSNISPFGYNETVAQEYFPVSPPPNLPLAGEGQKKSQLIQFSSPPAREGLGEGARFNWSTYEPPFPKVEKIIPASKLPDNIADIPDDILNWAIECEITKKPFRIIKQELEFYRKHNLPIPKRHPDQRHLDRMALRNPRKLFDRKCDKCGKDMKTTYSPERKEIVYCEECYNKEIY